MTVLAKTLKYAGSTGGLNILALAGKVSFPLLKVFVKLIKAAKVIKGSLILTSAVSYAYLFSWQFAAVIMCFLLVHEYGHVWAMKRCGMKTKGMYFIPFLGAAAVTDGEFPSYEVEVYTALMGPVWGMVLAFALAGLFLCFHQPLLIGASIWMFTVTAFNLLPIMPLDGGRVLRAIAMSLSSWGGIVVFVIGVGTMVYLFKVIGLGLILIFLIIGGVEVLGESFMVIMGKRKIKKIKNLIGELETDSVRIEAAMLQVAVLSDGYVDWSKALEVTKAIKENKRMLEIEQKLMLSRKGRTPMVRRDFAFSLVCLAGVAGLCIGYLLLLSAMPGADLALKLLQD